MMARTRILGVVIVGLLAACGTSQAGTPDDPAQPPYDSVTPVTADWTDHAVTVTLDNGWTVQRCEGDAPLLCVLDGSRIVGDIELAEYPAGDDLASDAVGGALRARAEGFLDSMRTDRAEGCPDFAFNAMDVTDATAHEAPAVRTGFSLTNGTGKEVERVVVHLAFHDRALWSINASGYVRDGGCLSDESQDFTPSDLRAFEPYLDALVEGTPLPTSSLPKSPDGQATAPFDLRIRLLRRA